MLAEGHNEAQQIICELFTTTLLGRYYHPNLQVRKLRQSEMNRFDQV